MIAPIPIAVKLHFPSTRFSSLFLMSASYASMGFLIQIFAIRFNFFKISKNIKYFEI